MELHLGRPSKGQWEQELNIVSRGKCGDPSRSCSPLVEFPIFIAWCGVEELSRSLPGLSSHPGHAGQDPSATPTPSAALI